jgi:hypothetical protein
MRTFVAVLQGETPQTARTVVATGDIRVIQAVTREILKCLLPGEECKGTKDNVVEMCPELGGDRMNKQFELTETGAK